MPDTADLASPGDDDEAYSMTISLNVLNHLGINLYSNLPSVLSEAVANAWDADASRVDIRIDAPSGTIVIQDDGHGMTRSEMNRHFLHVGYRRRHDSEDPVSGPITPKFDRRVMGRKGIGKLSLFSIANDITVESAARRPWNDEGAPIQSSGFRMRLDDIRDQIGEGASETYRPDPIDNVDLDGAIGTRITLTNLRKDAGRTAKHLIRRLARRFTMIGDGFSLTVDGHEVTAADRDLEQLVRYAWIYASPERSAELRASLERHDVIVEARPPLEWEGQFLEGWIGTAKTSSALRASDDDDSLNKILLFVRRKLAQEDLLGTTDEGGLFTKYIVGQLNADFLDIDEEEDIATSSRQQIVEDDPRFDALREFVRTEIRYIEGAWNQRREAEGEKVVREEIPKIAEWLDSLTGDDKKAARRFFGKLNSIPSEGEARKRLLTSGVLAFESMRRRRRLSDIESVQDSDLPALISAFKSMDDVESAYFYEIVRDRIRIIEKFEGLVGEDALERVLQDYLFDHLWLLDPGWERTTTPVMEKTVAKLIGKKATTSDLKSRVDIKYRQSGGAHVIVELKKASVRTTTFELLAQINRYRSGVVEYLESTEGAQVDLQLICVVGSEPPDWGNPDGRSSSRDALSSYSARIVTYDLLIRQAKESYGEFLEAHNRLGPIRDLLGTIEDQLEL